jgi:hypothetical protein
MPVGRDYRSSTTFSLLGGALSQQLCDVEIDEIGVMKND